MISVMKLTHDLREVKRTIPLPGRGYRRENDVEHSYQLAMLAWYIMDVFELRLNRAVVYEYCLCHDLPEAKVGDVHCLANAKVKRLKHEKEREARRQIKLMFPEFNALHESMEEYERRDPGNYEAAFVYALDKFLPMVNIIISGKPHWKRQGITRRRILRNKRPKITSIEVLRPAYEDLVKYLRVRPQLFKRSKKIKRTLARR
jgi:putative hydrolase of HD superfamily